MAPDGHPVARHAPAAVAASAAAAAGRHAANVGSGDAGEGRQVAIIEPRHLHCMVGWLVGWLAG